MRKGVRPKSNDNDFSKDERKLILFMGGDPDNFDDEDEETTGVDVLAQGCLVLLLALIGLLVLCGVCSAG